MNKQNGTPNPFYNYNNLFSRQALFNFIIGERGVGKTYGILKKVVKDFTKALANGDRNPPQFIYLRRYKTELKNFKSIFDPLIANKVIEEERLVVVGNKVLIDNQVAGYAFPVSTAATLKSSSFPFVNTIIFDEFIIDRGTYHYLTNEVDKFLECYETIARLRDVKVFFLGNAVTIANPYFDFFNLSLPYDGEFKMFKDGLICVNYIKNEVYRALKKETKFGRLIAETNYAAYAIDNQMLRDNSNFVVHKSGICTPILTLVISGKPYGLWQGTYPKSVSSDHKLEGVMVFYWSEDYDPNCKEVFAVHENDHDSLSQLYWSNRLIFDRVARLYSSGRVFFDNMLVKSKVLSIILPTNS